VGNHRRGLVHALTHPVVHNIKLNGKDGELHAYWDEGLNTFPRSGADFTPPPLSTIPPAVTKALQGHPDTDPDVKLDDPFNFDAWSRESNDLAQHAAYQDIAEGQAPSSTYKTRGVEIARKRVAFAGYRLAALLNAIWPDTP
jgi:S1/P1 nuclease